MEHLPHAGNIPNWIKSACESNQVGYLASSIKISFSKRLTRRFGLAYCQSRLIKVSEPLWLRATEEERKQVVQHEVCHIISTYKYGAHTSAHGDEWKNCMRAAGLMPHRCHQIDRTGLKRSFTKYEIECGCMKRWIGHKIAYNIRNDLRGYSCSKCKQVVQLTGIEYRPE